MDGDYPGPIGLILGGLTALAVFLYSWFYAVASWGWLLGLAFGWIPASIVASMAGFLMFWLWGPIAFIILLLIGLSMKN